MGINFSPLLSVLPILLFHSYGVSEVSIKLFMIQGSPLYSLVPSNISTLLAAKINKISLECSRQVMGVNSGLSTSLGDIKALLVFLEALSMVKKSLSLNFQIILTQPSTQGLL